jgi:hypothetical protein
VPPSQGSAELRSRDFSRFPFPRTNFRGLLNRPRVHNTPVHIKLLREGTQGWRTKREYPKPEVAAHMMKFSDTLFELKPGELIPDWVRDPVDHGHVAFAILNLPLGPDEEEEGPGLPPGMPPGFMQPGMLAGGFGIQIGPVTTVGQVLADMGLAPGGVPPP